MPAPIAEVSPPAPHRTPKKPPRSLSVMVGAGLALGVSDLILAAIYPTRIMTFISTFWENIISFALLFGVLSVIHFAPLLLTLRGANWARWLMIAVSILGISFVFVPTEQENMLPAIREFINRLYAPYYLALIIFLLSPPMRRYFPKPHKEAP